ncbi:MAG: T9SS type A sorting domain-containing protein [Bacteroidia bacterium]
MKTTFTKISSVILMGCALFVSASSFAQSGNKASITKKSNDKKPDCVILGTVLDQQNETCYGGTSGLAVLYAFGSTGPYTFSWSGGITSSTLDSINGTRGLAAGTYTVTITNALGCTGTVDVTITQPSKITATNTIIDDICYGGNNGSATIAASGGTPKKNNPNYTYAWAPAVSTADSAKNLTAGTYIVTVTDSNRCTAKDTVVITQPAQIATKFNVVPSSCKTVNGSVGIVASAGVLPYTYSWSPGGNTNDTLTGLGAGTYTCTVTDAHGCTVSPVAIVSDSTTLRDSITSQANESCYGDSIGFAAIGVKGGSGPVTFNWAPWGGTDTLTSGLAAGTYTFTATDSTGCEAITTVTITQPKALRDSMSRVTNVACHGGSTGRVTVGIAGGTSPYTYSWSTGATTSSITGVPAGPLTVVITDNNGCMDSAMVTITQPATAVADSNIISNVTCYGGTNGFVIAYAYGGTPYIKPPSYSYRWNNGVTSTTDTAAGLAAGTYVVRISDSNRCNLHDTIVITQPASFILQTDTTISFQSSPCMDSAWVVLSTADSGYTFSWSPSGGSTDTATGLCPGTYIATITNSVGCVENDTILVGSAVGIPDLSSNESIKVYPNPATDQINISISGNSIALQNVAVFDITGRQLMTEKVDANSSLLTLDVSKLSEGAYFLKLTGNNVKVFKFTVAR